MSKRLIGLTGGIGTGKSTVSRYLATRYELPILDADIYAKEAVTPNFPIWRQIIKRYDSTIQLPDGSLNRKVLGEIIFNNPTEKSWLEGKIHPYVRDRFLSEGQQLKADTVVLVIPLLFEAKMTDLVTEIWVVSCSEQQQLGRLIERDRLTPEQARARIQSQLPLSTKIAGADLILANSSTLDNLLFQIDTALKL